MKESMLILKSEIETELATFEKLCNEMSQVLKCETPSFLETRAAGSILHDFYSGVEKIFKRIAASIDRDLPDGEEWQADLLRRMSIPIEEIRPPVISESLRDELFDFLRFRHIFRNIYGFELKWERCIDLAMKMDVMITKFRDEMQIYRFN